MKKLLLFLPLLVLLAGCNKEVVSQEEMDCERHATTTIGLIDCKQKLHCIDCQDTVNSSIRGNLMRA